MKKLLLLLLLVPMHLDAQIVYDKQNQDYFIDYNNNILNLNYNGTIISGSFEKLKGKDFYSYLVANGGNYHLVMKIFTDSQFQGIDVLKGDFKDVLKGFNKGRNYGKKVEIIYSSLPNPPRTLSNEFDLITEFEIERQRKESEFSKLILESGYVGVYKIKILNHRNLNYADLDYTGKIIITEVGITIETDIPSIDLVRGSYNVDMSDEVSNGRFVCDITKGFGEFFSLSLNTDNGVGAFTSMGGSTRTTTTFKIE